MIETVLLRFIIVMCVATLAIIFGIAARCHQLFNMTYWGLVKELFIGVLITLLITLAVAGFIVGAVYWIAAGI